VVGLPGHGASEVGYPDGGVKEEPHSPFAWHPSGSGHGASEVGYPDGGVNEEPLAVRLAPLGTESLVSTGSR
jgi:hypothetical protein